MKYLTHINLIEYSAVIEQSIEQIDLLKSILNNKYNIQSTRLLTNLNERTNIIEVNIESSILLNRLSANDFQHSKLDKQLTEQTKNLIEKSKNFKKYQLIKNDLRINCSSSSLILSEQEDFYTDFRLNLALIDKNYIDICIISHLLNSLNGGLLSENSYQIFYNDFVLFKKENQSPDESFQSELIQYDKSNMLRSDFHVNVIRNLNNIIKKKRSLLTNVKLKNTIQIKYLTNWQNLHKIETEKKLQHDLNIVINEQNILKQKIDEEKIANFSMIASLRNQISNLNELEVNSLKKYNDSIEEFQQKINKLKNKVSKQKNLINNLQSEIKTKSKYVNDVKLAYSLR